MPAHATLAPPLPAGSPAAPLVHSAADPQTATAALTLQLAGLTCGACAGVIEDALNRVDGVAWSRVNAATQLARIGFDPARTGEADLVQAVRRAGYDAAADTPESAAALRQRERRATLWRLFVAAFCAMQVMMLATPMYVAEAGTLAPDIRALLNWGSWVLTLPVLGFSGTPYLRAALRSVAQRRLGMEVPVAIGLVVTFMASTVAAFDPAGPLGHEVYFDSLTMFLAFLWLGRWLEMGVRHRAADHLEASLDGLPAQAIQVSDDGRLVTVETSALRRGDRLRVRPGDTVPADGTLACARAELSEALLTGEAAAVVRRQGDAVLAGSVNEGQVFDLLVTQVGPDTRLQAIVGLMREALSTRPAAARLADRWAAPFLAAVLLLAAAAAAAWSLVDPGRAVWVAVSVLIVTCPCALSLATPATLVAAAGGLARRGLLLRRLDALERLARADRIVFDKTGTLTQPRPQASLVQAVDADADLARATSLARLSSHPLAAGLAELRANVDESDAPVEPDPAVRGWHDVREEPGRGMQARDERGRLWRLGSAEWVGAPAEDASARVWLACEGRVRARFAMREALRADACMTVRQLQAQGLQVALVTGDAAGRAHEVAGAVGVVDVVAGATPQGKLEHIRAERARGHVVAAVGDGINDAPLLAAADVSFALGHAAAAAREGADAVIVGDRLAVLVDARCTAGRTLSIVRQNLLWAAAYNAACIPLALAGWLPPWAAGLGMAASSLLVILNAQRAAWPPRADAAADGVAARARATA
jgi:Cu2+-exporting ATPase